MVDVIRPSQGVSGPQAERVVDANGATVTPGFVDIHAHLRYPGFPDKETIASGTSAAIRGGFTTICAMANSDPPIDSPSRLENTLEMVAREARCRVALVGAVSKGLEGQANTDAGGLHRAGAAALSDDGNPVMDPSIMAKALEASDRLGIPVSAHEERWSGAHGNRDPASPCDGEVEMIRRDLDLLRRFGGRLHIAHVSCRESVELVGEAQAAGLPVTAEVTPHHLQLYRARLPAVGLPHGHPNGKVNPPLRSLEDLQALQAGLASGVLSAVATDHAPHSRSDKTGSYQSAAFGFTGFELALPLLVRLVKEGVLGLPKLVERLTLGPARAFQLSAGTLKPGARADVCIFDPDRRWEASRDSLVSKGKNTPLSLQSLTGRVLWTVAGDRLHSFRNDHELRAFRAS